MAVDDGHDGVFAQAEVTRDQPVAEALADERHDAGGVSICLRTLPRLAAEDFAARLRSGQA